MFLRAHGRLYTQAQVTQMKITKLQEAKSQQETKGCTFTRQTNNTRAKGPSPLPTGGESAADVTARMEKYQLMREKKIEELRLAKEALEAQEATFKPASYTSTRKSQRSSSRERGDVFTRLHETTKKASSSAEQDWEKEHTFRPTLVTTRAPSVRSYTSCLSNLIANRSFSLFTVSYSPSQQKIATPVFTRSYTLRAHKG